MRMLSGLYGLLRPTDIIKPYRLDMSKKLLDGKGMEVFWREKVSKVGIGKGKRGCSNSRVIF